VDVGVVCVCVHILYDLLEVCLVDFDVARVFSVGAGQFFRVGIQIVVHECHLDFVFIFDHLLDHVRVDFPSHFLKDVVTLSCEGGNLVSQRQPRHFLEDVHSLLLEVSSVKLPHQLSVLLHALFVLDDTDILA
jgi:hypothetical protein